LNAKTLIVYNVTLPYIPERNDKTSRYVVCFHDVHYYYYYYYYYYYSGKYQAHTFKQKTSQKHYIK
jgi:hypothetical protein